MTIGDCDFVVTCSIIFRVYGGDDPDRIAREVIEVLASGGRLPNCVQHIELVDDPVEDPQ